MLYTEDGASIVVGMLFALLGMTYLVPLFIDGKELKYRVGQILRLAVLVVLLIVYSFWCQCVPLLSDLASM